MKRARVLKSTLIRCRPAFVIFAVGAAATSAVFVLYRLPMEPLFYALALVAAAAVILFLVTLFREAARESERERLLRACVNGDGLPASLDPVEEEYREAIRRLQAELSRCQSDYFAARQDEIDYYTAWVHQIKTPIAVMRMTLGDGTDEHRGLETELFRIERYVDMVLQYLRLGSDTNDLVIRAYPLDELVREVIRKFAPQFVAKKLSLTVTGTEWMLVTDKKWFACLLEQLVSNAVKYTSSGGVTVSLEDGFLRVRDTGPGILPEDVPRIFEKGYTGENGRTDRRSTGLGLYLAHKAAALLDLPLSVESRVGTGSCFSLDLRGKLKAAEKTQ